MGRPPSNGGPPFRFNAAEVSEMETILQDHNNMMPAQEVLVAIADKFSNSPERQGKFVVQTKQIWNWFQNKRYAIRARTSKIPTKLNVSSMQSVSAGVPLQSASVVSTMPAAQAKTSLPVAPYTHVISREDNLSSSRLPHSVADAPVRISADNSQLEFEARSARDGAWYDVASFLSLRNLDTGCPEVLVRFAGFGPEEDEWINVTTHVRHRSLPCESSECVAVLPGDLILCFQEGKEQALYFDAHVLDAQRRRHDARGCRCRFLVRYDHDQSEEIVPLRKICRRPETDYRLQQLHAMNDSSAEQRKSAASKEQHKVVSSVEQIKTDVDSSSSKEGISKSVTLSDQKPPAPIALINTSTMSEGQNAVDVSSTDKPAGDINAASNNAQLSHQEVINLDPETEVVNNTHDVKDAVLDMVVETNEPLAKVTDKTCLPAEDTDNTVTPNMTAELINQAPLAVEAERAPKAGHADPEPMVVETNTTTDEGNDSEPMLVETNMTDEGNDSEPMLVETNMTTDDGKTNIDRVKDESFTSTGTYLTQEAIIPLSGLPADAEVNEVKVDVPEMTSNMGNVLLEQNVLETSAANATDAAGNTDADSCNATPSCVWDDAGNPVGNSGLGNPSTTNASVHNCFEKVDDPI